MGKFVDYSGQRFGRLVVVKRIGTKERGTKTIVKTPLWLCQCDCGNEKIVTSVELRSGDTQSCGCLHNELLSQRNTTHGDAHKNGENYRLYKIWFGMKERCENPSEKSYRYYGERGISVCDEWHDYEEFRSWALSHGYNKDLTIDRIDVDGIYSPDNCRWVNYKTQANNKRSCRYVEINGEIKTITEWCEIYGINRSTTCSRIDRFGWNPVDAIVLPAAKKHFYKDRM